ncbi:ATP-binding protein [Actinoplanes sp. NPDC049668]|uniref:ATP-binding protein n=1 Tax=unclassified Actinoplanes TaxID=2626549 RepID=UPI0033B44F97
MGTDERQRLAALHGYRVLDGPADDELEAVVRVAATVAGVRTAALNLIDEDRQCQLAGAGLAGTVSPRADSLCAVHFRAGEFVWVADAAADPAYKGNPWVDGRRGDIRFYASAPLVTAQGHALGTLCVFDAEPRELDDEQIDRLKDLARVVLALLERRRQARVHGELLRSNGELEQFAAVVSHDLAAPLSVVGGYLDLLADEYAEALDERAGGWITGAARAVGRMQGLIEALLTYARVGGEPRARGDAELGEAVHQALLDLGDLVRQGGAVIGAPSAPVTLACDPTLLRQLLQNLIGNGIKYRDPARPCRVEVAAERGDAGDWLVTVTDNGIGIPADQRHRVFEMFARVDPRSGAGHGIGLSTCRRIVERHGGRIWAAAAPGGVGTTVSFTLPGA